MFTDINDSDTSIMCILPARPRIASSAAESFTTPDASRRQRAPTSPPMLLNKRLKLSSKQPASGCEPLLLLPLLEKSSSSSSTSPFKLSATLPLLVVKTFISSSPSSFKLKVRQRLQDQSELDEFTTTSPGPSSDERLDGILFPATLTKRKADPSSLSPPPMKYQAAHHVITPLYAANKLQTVERLFLNGRKSI